MLVQFTYLITKDIVETIEQQIQNTLSSNAQNRLRLLEEEFLKKFWTFIPGTIDKRIISAQELRKELSYITKTIPFVSLDRIYFLEADAYLDITRITNPETYSASLGPRPGAKTINEQIEEIKKYDRIMLGDVGAFEGNTIIDITTQIERAGIRVENIILGCVGRDARTKIELIKPLTALYTFAFYEWIELRDLFGIDGRKTENSAYIPYWNNLRSWASIEEKNIAQVEQLCREAYAQTIAVLRNEEIQKIRLSGVER